MTDPKKTSGDDDESAVDPAIDQEEVDEAVAAAMKDTHKMSLDDIKAVMKEHEKALAEKKKKNPEK